MIFWVCICVVVIAAIGMSGLRKMKALNTKYHIIEVEHGSVYADDDEE